MGATVSTGKLVAAFQSTAGKTFYVLYEQTYEKNTDSRLPKWHARAMGDLAAALRTIFWSASACEGGMVLSASHRYITPEGYIADWLKELANPVEIADVTFDLAVTHYWSAVIKHDDFRKVRPQLEATGAVAMATSLAAGESVSASLYADAEALSAIFDGVHIGAWRIFNAHGTPIHGTRNPALGYATGKTKPKAVPLDTTRYMKVEAEGDSFLKMGSDGAWRYAGWTSHLMSDFITGAWKAELETPGVYRAQIKAFRQALKAAPAIPKGAKVLIDTTVPVEPFQMRNIERVTSQLGAVTEGTELHLAVPTTFDDLYAVIHLPTACTKWVFSDNAPSEQLSLLAS